MRVPAQKRSAVDTPTSATSQAQAGTLRTAASALAAPPAPG